MKIKNIKKIVEIEITFSKEEAELLENVVNAIVQEPQMSKIVKEEEMHILKGLSDKLMVALEF